MEENDQTLRKEEKIKKQSMKVQPTPPLHSVNQNAEDTKKKKKPSPTTDRLTLHPAKFEDVLQALLRTPPPPSSKKSKR